MVRFAFHGRGSTEDQQDPTGSKTWQLERSRALIDHWLDDLFSPERIDETLDLILAEDADIEATRARARLEDELRRCDQRTTKYRSLLDDGVDPALVAGWLEEVTAERVVAERRIAELDRETDGTTVDRDQVRRLLAEIGGMAGLLSDGDAAERARFYEAVGITGTYEPQVNRLILTTPRWAHGSCRRTGVSDLNA